MFNKLLDYFKNINSYKDLKVKDASNVLKQNNESVHYYDFDEKLNIHAPEVQEEKKYFI